MYIDSEPEKAVKGGFAIGGFHESKGLIQDYMVVSRDSVRIYIDDQAKAVKGGFAIGGFHESKAGAKSFLDVATVAGGIINPSENRILWYPLKNSFLTGRVLIENPDSVGENSFASGFESKSAGIYSQALGFKAIARGEYSTAVGKNAVAGKVNSFAFGDGVVANGVNSYAFGKGAMATSDGSYAFGFNAQASGQDALAFGTGTQATGNGSFALGFIGRDSAGLATTNTKATGDWSFALGMGSQSINRGAITLGTLCNANGQFAFASGYQSVASGNFSIAMGSNAKATNEYAVAIGIMASASNSGDVALGHGRASGGGSIAINYGEATNHASFASNASKATGRYSTSTGYGNQASGDASVNIGGAGSIAAGYCSATFGYNNIARGFYSTSMGFANSSPGYMSVATGNYTISRSHATLVVGRYNDTTNMSNISSWVLTDPVFVVGNGTSNSLRKNAFTILKNGKVGIGVLNPYYNMTVVGDTEKGVLMVSPNYDDQSNGNAEIILAEDYWGNYRMKIQYNGNENKLHFIGGYASTDYSPQHMTINRHGGFVGIGNPNPTARLHVQGTTKSVTPTGTAAAAGQFQAWTEGTAQGQLAVFSLYPTFQGTADNGPRRAADIVGGFNGGSWGNEYLSFNVGRSGSANDGQSVNNERMRITGNGNIGIGTSNPGTYRLYVSGSAYSTGGWSGSDLRWKKDIIEVDNVIEEVLKLRPVKYSWRIDDFPEISFEPDKQLGLIAQEVENVFPELVRTDMDGYKSISYEKLTVILIQGMKEQQKQIELAVSESTSLRLELATLKERLSALEVSISNK
jgi:hypothetical protein